MIWVSRHIETGTVSYISTNTSLSNIRFNSTTTCDAQEKNKDSDSAVQSTERFFCFKHTDGNVSKQNAGETKAVFGIPEAKVDTHSGASHDSSQAEKP